VLFALTYYNMDSYCHNSHFKAADAGCIPY